MTDFASLGQYMAHLMKAEIIPKPPSEEWKAMLIRSQSIGTIAEICEETWFYFLEVLPPKYQTGGMYAFAEGAEALRVYWRKEGRYFTRQLSWDETVEFCCLARIPLPC